MWPIELVSTLSWDYFWPSFKKDALVTAHKVNPTIRAELAPTGTLRAAIYTRNFLLVNAQGASGDPTGVSPDVARRLGTPLKLISYPDPGLLGDAAAAGEWDIGNIGAEPQRAQTIAFSNAYCEIASTYLVPAGSKIQTIEEVDRTNIRIASKGLAAYGLWLENNLHMLSLSTPPLLTRLLRPLSSRS